MYKSDWVGVIVKKYTQKIAQYSHYSFLCIIIHFKNQLYILMNFYKKITHSFEWVVLPEWQLLLSLYIAKHTLSRKNSPRNSYIGERNNYFFSVLSLYTTKHILSIKRKRIPKRNSPKKSSFVMQYYYIL